MTSWGFRVSGGGKGETVVGNDESPVWTSGAKYKEKEQEKRGRQSQLGVSVT